MTVRRGKGESPRRKALVGGTLLIVRGPLGAGKTTVARALAAELGGPVVSIDEILEQDTWDGGSEALFMRANLEAARRAQGPIARGVSVIVDGNFYWKSALDDLVRRVGAPHRVFLLDVPLRICIERDRGRPVSHGEAGARAVYAKVRRVPTGIRIDGRRTVPEVVRAIRSRLSGASAPSRDDPRAKRPPVRRTPWSARHRRPVPAASRVQVVGNRPREN